MDKPRVRRLGEIKHATVAWKAIYRAWIATMIWTLGVDGGALAIAVLLILILSVVEWHEQNELESSITIQLPEGASLSRISFSEKEKPRDEP